MVPLKGSRGCDAAVAPALKMPSSITQKMTLMINAMPAQTRPPMAMPRPYGCCSAISPRTRATSTGTQPRNGTQNRNSETMPSTSDATARPLVGAAGGAWMLMVCVGGGVGAAPGVEPAGRAHRLPPSAMNVMVAAPRRRVNRRVNAADRRSLRRELGQHLVGADAVAGLDVDHRDGAVALGADDVLHLHRFDDAERLARLHFLPGRDIHRDHQPWHRRDHQLGGVGDLLRWQAAVQVGRNRGQHQHLRRRGAVADAEALGRRRRLRRERPPVQFGAEQRLPGPPVDDAQPQGAALVGQFDQQFIDQHPPAAPGRRCPASTATHSSRAFVAFSTAW